MAEKPGQQPAGGAKGAKSGKGGKGKLLLIVLMLAVVLAGAGAAAWWFLLRPHGQPSPQELAAQRAKAVHFIALDSFLSNVASQDGNPHYLQVKLELKTADPGADEKVKAMTPEIRNAVLRILGSQHAEQAATVQVREQLRAQILQAVNAVLGGRPAPALPAASGARPAPVTGPISGVYFTAYVVQ